jgi:hypothetical protein
MEYDDTSRESITEYVDDMLLSKEPIPMTKLNVASYDRGVLPASINKDEVKIIGSDINFNDFTADTTNNYMVRKYNTIYALNAHNERLSFLTNEDENFAKVMSYNLQSIRKQGLSITAVKKLRTDFMNGRNYLNIVEKTVADGMINFVKNRITLDEYIGSIVDLYILPMVLKSYLIKLFTRLIIKANKTESTSAAASFLKVLYARKTANSFKNMNGFDIIMKKVLNLLPGSTRVFNAYCVGLNNHNYWFSYGKFILREYALDIKYNQLNYDSDVKFKYVRLYNPDGLYFNNGFSKETFRDIAAYALLPINQNKIDIPNYTLYAQLQLLKNEQMVTSIRVEYRKSSDDRVPQNSIEEITKVMNNLNKEGADPNFINEIYNVMFEAYQDEKHDIEQLKAMNRDGINLTYKRIIQLFFGFRPSYNHNDYLFSVDNKNNLLMNYINSLDYDVDNNTKSSSLPYEIIEDGNYDFLRGTNDSDFVVSPNYFEIYTYFHGSANNNKAGADNLVGDNGVSIDLKKQLRIRQYKELLRGNYNIITGEFLNEEIRDLMLTLGEPVSIFKILEGGSHNDTYVTFGRKNYKKVSLDDFTIGLDFKSEDNNCLLEILRRIASKGDAYRFPSSNGIRKELKIQLNSRINVCDTYVLKLLEDYFKVNINIANNTNVIVNYVDESLAAVELILQKRSANKKSFCRLFTMKDLKTFFKANVSCELNYIRKSENTHENFVDIYLKDNHYVFVRDIVFSEANYCKITGKKFDVNPSTNKMVKFTKTEIEDILVKQGRLVNPSKRAAYFAFDFETVFNEVNEEIVYSVVFYDCQKAKVFDEQDILVTLACLDECYRVEYSAKQYSFEYNPVTFIKGHHYDIGMQLIALLKRVSDEYPTCDYSCYLYGYNNSRFDNFFLLDYMNKFDTIKADSAFHANGSILKMNIFNFEVLDLCRFTNASLKEVCGAYGINEDVGKLDLDHKIVQALYQKDKCEFYHTLKNETGIFEQLREYNVRDCTVLKVLFDVLNSCFGKMFADPIFAYDGIQNYMTISSLCYTMFKRTFSANPVLGTNNQIIYGVEVPLTHDIMVKIRKSFIAGRSQVFQKGKFRGIFESNDIVSMYPYILICDACYFPTGKLEKYIKLEKFVRYEKLLCNTIPADKLGFYYCRIYNQPDVKIIPLREKGSPLDWTYSGMIECWLNTIDIITCIEFGCVVKINEGFYYEGKSNQLFKKYYEGPTNMKKQEDVYRDTKDPKFNKAQRSIAKLASNSLSGKPAQKCYCEKVLRTKDRVEFEVFMNKYINEGYAQDIVFNIVDGLYIVKVKSEKFYSQDICNELQYASYIYAHARRHMYLSIFADRKSTDFYIQDTDSITTTIDVIDEIRSYTNVTKDDIINANFYGKYVDRITLNSLGFPSNYPMPYGSFTPEYHDDFGMELTSEKNIYLFAPKFYAVEGVNKDGKVVQKIKAKGVKKDDKVIEITKFVDTLLKMNPKEFKDYSFVNDLRDNYLNYLRMEADYIKYNKIPHENKGSNYVLDLVKYFAKKAYDSLDSFNRNVIYNEAQRCLTISLYEKLVVEKSDVFMLSWGIGKTIHNNVDKNIKIIPDKYKLVDVFELAAKFLALNDSEFKKSFNRTKLKMIQKYFEENNGEALVNYFINGYNVLKKNTQIYLFAKLSGDSKTKHSIRIPNSAYKNVDCAMLYEQIKKECLDDYEGLQKFIDNVEALINLKSVVDNKASEISYFVKKFYMELPTEIRLNVFINVSKYSDEFSDMVEIYFNDDELIANKAKKQIGICTAKIFVKELLQDDTRARVNNSVAKIAAPIINYDDKYEKITYNTKENGMNNRRYIFNNGVLPAESYVDIDEFKTNFSVDKDYVNINNGDICPDMRSVTPLYYKKLYLNATYIPAEKLITTDEGDEVFEYNLDNIKMLYKRLMAELYPVTISSEKDVVESAQVLMLQGEIKFNGLSEDEFVKQISCTGDEWKENIKQQFTEYVEDNLTYNGRISNNAVYNNSWGIESFQYLNNEAPENKSKTLLANYTLKKIEQNNWMIIREESLGGFNQFLVFGDIDRFHKYMANSLRSTTFHEVIMPTLPRKFYLDIDCESITDIDEYNRHIEEIKVAIEYVLSSELIGCPALDFNDFIEVTAHSKPNQSHKFSSNIIVKSCLIKDQNVFSRIGKKVIAKYMKNMKLKYNEIIDENQFNKSVIMNRVIGSFKKGEREKIIAQNDYNWKYEECFITNKFDIKRKDLKILVDAGYEYDLKKARKEKKLNAKKRVNYVGGNIKEGLPRLKAVIKHLYETDIFPEIHNHTIRRCCTKYNSCTFYRTAASECTLCNKEHKKDNSLFITMYNDKLYQKCFKAKGANKFICDIKDLIKSK